MSSVNVETGEFNPIFMMADSGARGSQQQIRQLAGIFFIAGRGISFPYWLK